MLLASREVGGIEFGGLKHELVGWLVAATGFQALIFQVFYAVILRGRFGT